MGDKRNKRMNYKQRQLVTQQQADQRAVVEAEEQTRKEQQEQMRQSRLRRQAEMEEQLQRCSHLKRLRRCKAVEEELVQQLFSPKSNLNDVEKKETLKRFWEDSRIRDFLPDLLKDLKETSRKLQVLESVQQAYAHMTLNKTTDNVIFRNTLLAAVVSGQNCPPQRFLCDTMQATRWNVQKAIVRRVHVDTTGEMFWGGMPRKERSDKISGLDRELILKWWDTATTISPEKKDIKRQRVQPKTFIEHPTHFLQESQIDFYTRFRKAHPSCEVGLRAFEALKPYYVRRLKDRNTCACKYHVEMAELLTGWNNMRSGIRGVHGKDCKCACDVCCTSIGGHCKADCSNFNGMTDLWCSIMCPEDEIWYKLDCLQGKCSDCGVDMLVTCPEEDRLDQDKVMEWRCYQKVVAGLTKAGKIFKVLRLQYKQTSPRIFLDYLRPKLRQFVAHNFVAKWEDEQFKTCLETFPADSIVSVVDFAENYSFVEFNEVQEMHWTSVQLTILVHIVYRWNELYLANPEAGFDKICTEYHYYISDDHEHDTLFVQHCFDLHWKGLTSRGFFPNQHLVWSDGCAAQFKSRRTIYHVARYQSLTRDPERLPNGSQMLWSYFGSGHGKGVHDGAGAILKQAIRKEQMNMDAIKLQNAADVVAMCHQKQRENHLAYANARRQALRFFHLVDRDEVDRRAGWDCKRLPGLRSLHSISSVSHRDVTLLRIREFACFCEHCMDDNDSYCLSKNHVQSWKLVTLEPINVEQVRNHIQGSAPNVEATVVEEVDMVDGDDSSDDDEVDLEPEAIRVELGSNFAVVADTPEKGDIFYVILCDKPVHRNPMTFSDDYGNTWYEGDSILRGIFYERVNIAQGRLSVSYRLIKDKAAYAYSHHVITSGFQMLPCATKKGLPRFSMGHGVRTEIVSALEAKQSMSL